MLPTNLRIRTLERYKYNINHIEGVQHPATVDDECIQALLKPTYWVQAVNLISTNCSRISNTPLTQKEEHFRMTREIVRSLLYYVTFVCTNTVCTLLSITVCVSVCHTIPICGSLGETMCTQQGDKKICNLIESASMGQSPLCPVAESVGKGPLAVSCDWGVMQWPWSWGLWRLCLVWIVVLLSHF